MLTVSGTMSRLSGLQVQRGPCRLALLLLPLLLGPSSVLAISFHLPINSRKCLREEIHKDLLVTGAYEITDQSGGAGGLRTHLKVRPGAGRGRDGQTSGVGEERRRMGAGEGVSGLASAGRRGRAVESAPSPCCLASAERGRASGRGTPGKGARPRRQRGAPGWGDPHGGRWRDPGLCWSLVP